MSCSQQCFMAAPLWGQIFTQNLVQIWRLMRPLTLRDYDEIDYWHNEAFYGEQGQSPSRSEMAWESKEGLSLWRAGGEAGLRAPPHWPGVPWFKFPSSARESTRAFLLACPDVGHKRKRRRVALKLSIIKHQKWSQTPYDNIWMYFRVYLLDSLPWGHCYLWIDLSVFSVSTLCFSLSLLWIVLPFC